MAARFETICPVFGITDLDASCAHYRGLGFAVESHGDEYAFARRDDVWIHLAVVPHHDPATAGAAYLYVDDAAALAREWGAPAPETTDYGLLEGHHLDPDNNLIRFGSPLGAAP